MWCKLSPCLKDTTVIGLGAAYAEVGLVFVV